MTVTYQKNIASLDYYKMLEDLRKRDGHWLMLSSYAMGMIRGIIEVESTPAKKVTAIKKVITALEKV